MLIIDGIDYRSGIFAFLWIVYPDTTDADRQYTMGEIFIIPIGRLVDIKEYIGILLYRET